MSAGIHSRCSITRTPRDGVVSLNSMIYFRFCIIDTWSGSFASEVTCVAVTGIWRTHFFGSTDVRVSVVKTSETSSRFLFFFSFLTLSQFACLLYNAWRFLVCMLTFSLSYAKFSFPVFSYIFSLFFTTKGDNVEEEELRNVRHEPG